MPTARKYPVELLERATRLAFESGRPIAHVAADLELQSQTLRNSVRQGSRYAGNAQPKAPGIEVPALASTTVEEWLAAHLEVVKEEKAAQPIRSSRSRCGGRGRVNPDSSGVSR
jgi:transposase-like protein